MNVRFFSSLFLMILLFSCEHQEVLYGEVAIIPKPAELTAGEGYFNFSQATSISVENAEQEKIVQSFFQQFQSQSSALPQIEIGNSGDIVFVTDSELNEEAYSLEVNTEKVTIKAANNAGFFYALQSFKQLLPLEIFGQEAGLNFTWAIPTVKIMDEPAFGWRGYMLDVSRHFFDKEQVMDVLDFMADLKLNRFHWHLCDDQGWRIEIKSYPKLTEIGAWRVDHNTLDETVYNWWGRPTAKKGEKPTYGGFYTQEDIKEIIAYAKERFIEVIPEIDMPGHAQATVAAYPEIGCVNAAPFVATGGVYKNNTYNPGKEITFEFADKMLNEVMDLFPYKYVHIGGDECNKEQWKVDPDAQQRIKEEGLKDEYELQSYFIRRIEKIINARDRIMIGWDEILEGGLAPNATVMSWRGEEGGIASAKAGHEVIMTPNNYCYLDLKQGHDDMEPNLGYSQLFLSKSYSYKVIPDSLNNEEAQLIKGVQANMWAESISDWGKLTYMTFPRLFAIAETAWTDYEDKNWEDFSGRLSHTLKRLDIQKVRYAQSAYSPWIDHQGKGHQIEISLKTEIPNLDIYYTLDGTEPGLQSNHYQAPFLLEESTMLKAQAFQDSVAVGYIAALEFPIHLAKGIFKDSRKLSPLTDLNYAKNNIDDPNWLTFNDDLQIDVPFDKTTTIQKVQFSTLRGSIWGAYPPEKVEIFSSTDGNNFTLLHEEEHPKQSTIQGRNRVTYTYDLSPTQVKTLRIKAFNLNPIPPGHYLTGASSLIKIDELVIY